MKMLVNKLCFPGGHLVAMGGPLQPPAQQLLLAAVSGSLIKTGGTTKQRVSAKSRAFFEEIPEVFVKTAGGRRGI